MQKPVVAVVGRPNVGKSTLFNKLIGKRVSIIDDSIGVTRDRVYESCTWNGRTFMLVDTGGIEMHSDDLMFNQMMKQTCLAIENANVILFVVDVKSGLTLPDEEIAKMLMKINKPVIVCVNKCDNIAAPDYNFYEFYNLGLGLPIAVSAIHGHGTGDLLDLVLENIPKHDENFIGSKSAINVAIIGRPNVGKSSLVNFLFGGERCIVSDISGTTRDIVDIQISNEFGNYNFIDTAGLRRRNKIKKNVEKYSVMRTKMAIDKADVCVIMLDASEEINEQDTKVAGLAHEAGKGCLFVVNKWDLVEKNSDTIKIFSDNIKDKFSFMSYAPILFISAKTGKRIDKIFGVINNVSNFNSMRISTGRLNEILSEAIVRVPPPSHKGKRLKIYYMTQVAVKPPTFVFFVNKSQLFHFSYQNYIENQIREIFGLIGTTLKFVLREKSLNKLH